MQEHVRPISYLPNYEKALSATLEESAHQQISTKGRTAKCVVSFSCAFVCICVFYSLPTSRFC